MADFPPTDVRISAVQEPYDYYRAFARAFPIAFMGVLVVICLFCAECAGRRERKERKLKAEARRAKELKILQRAPIRAKDPSEHVPYKSPRWYYLHEKEFTDSGRMPSSSSESPPPSFDPTNFSFGYGNSSMVGEVRSDLEATYKEPRESPAQTSTPPFARLRQTPPALFKKEEDQPDNSQQDQPDSSRSPSPQTLIRQGKEMRYGTWVREPPSTSSSATSNTSQLSATLFQMSISDDEARRAREEEKRVKDRLKLLKEKKRLKKEMMEEQAAIIRQQIAWTAKDEEDQKGRESRAIDIPPRKRMEEHPVFQQMVMAMEEENNAEFDATTVLNSVWEKGMMEDFLRRYAPDMGAVGGPVEDFSTLRHVKEEDTIEDPPDDDTQPLLPEKHKRSKSRAAEDLSRYYVKKVVPEDEHEASRGARRKTSRETGARSKADLSQYYVPATDDGGAQHGARRKVPLETGVKSEAAPDESRHLERKVAPETEASEGPETEGEASQHHVVRWKSPLETVFTFEAPPPQCKQCAKKKRASIAAAKDKAAAILFYQQMAGKKPLSATQAKGSTTQPPIHRPVKRVSGTKGEASQLQCQHHGPEKKSSRETSAKDEASQLQCQHHGSEKKSSRETSAKGEASQLQCQHHDPEKKSSLGTSAKGEASPLQCQHHGPEKSSLETSAKVEASQSQFQHGAKKKSSLKTSTKGKAAAVSDDSQPLLLQHGVGKKTFPETEARSDVFQPPIHLPVKRVAEGGSSQPPPPHGSGRKVQDAQAIEEKHKGSVDKSSPLFHHYGAGKNYGTMLPEVHPIGVFTKKMMDTRVPLVKGKEFEEKSISETRKVSSKIAKAVFDIEMKRIEDQMITSLLKTTKKDSEQHVVEIHREPPSSGSIRRKPTSEVEIHQNPSTSGLIKRKPSPAVDKGEHVVETQQEPSSSGSIRKKPTSEVEIHQNPSTSGRRKPSPAVDKGEHVVETQREPSSSGSIRRKPSPVVEESEDFVEIHLEPSSSEVIRRKPSVAEDTVIDLGSEDTSSSWEDISHKQNYLWWPGIGDRKKKGAKRKKYGKK